MAMRAGMVEKKRGIAAGTSGRKWGHPRWGIAIRSGSAGTAENKGALGRSRGLAMASLTGVLRLAMSALPPKADINDGCD